MHVFYKSETWIQNNTLKIDVDPSQAKFHLNQKKWHDTFYFSSFFT